MCRYTNMAANETVSVVGLLWAPRFNVMASAVRWMKNWNIRLKTALLTSVPCYKLLEYPPIFPGQMLESAKQSARTNLCPLRVLTALKSRRRKEKKIKREWLRLYFYSLAITLKCSLKMSFDDVFSRAVVNAKVLHSSPTKTIKITNNNNSNNNNNNRSSTA